MERRKLLKSLSLLPLTGAAILASPTAEAAAKPKERLHWIPRKQVIKPAAGSATANRPVSGNSTQALPSVLSSCIRSGHLLFLAGIGGWYVERRAEPGDIQVQIRSALTTMRSTLENAGSSMANVLKVHMTVVEPNKNLAALNEAYRGFFPDPPPVRSYTGCGADQMGKDGILVQIDCIAYVD